MPNSESVYVNASSKLALCRILRLARFLLRCHILAGGLDSMPSYVVRFLAARAVSKYSGKGLVIRSDDTQSVPPRPDHQTPHGYVFQLTQSWL